MCLKSSLKKVKMRCILHFYTECSSTTYGQNCGSQCTCELRNIQSCDKQNGTCYCSSGWQGVNCTEDVPECTNTPDICRKNALCDETEGSYVCACHDGFEKIAAGMCESKFKEFT